MTRCGIFPPPSPIFVSPTLPSRRFAPQIDVSVETKPSLTAGVSRRIFNSNHASFVSRKGRNNTKTNGISDIRYEAAQQFTEFPGTPFSLWPECSSCVIRRAIVGQISPPAKHDGVCSVHTTANSRYTHARICGQSSPKIQAKGDPDLIATPQNWKKNATIKKPKIFSGRRMRLQLGQFYIYNCVHIVFSNNRKNE